MRLRAWWRVSDVAKGEGRRVHCSGMQSLHSCIRKGGHPRNIWRREVWGKGQLTSPAYPSNRPSSTPPGSKP